MYSTIQAGREGRRWEGGREGGGKEKRALIREGGGKGGGEGREGRWEGREREESFN
jgi:hypothetical protein